MTRDNHARSVSTGPRTALCKRSRQDLNRRGRPDRSSRVPPRPVLSPLLGVLAVSKRCPGADSAAELSQPRESLEMVGAGPHPPPTVTLGREAAPRAAGFDSAMRRPQVSAVDHAPTPSRISGEARMDVTWAGEHGGSLVLTGHTLILSSTGPACPGTPVRGSHPPRCNSRWPIDATRAMLCVRCFLPE